MTKMSIEWVTLSRNIFVRDQLFYNTSFAASKFFCLFKEENIEIQLSIHGYNLLGAEVISKYL